MLQKALDFLPYHLLNKGKISGISNLSDFSCRSIQRIRRVTTARRPASPISPGSIVPPSAAPGQTVPQPRSLCKQVLDLRVHTPQLVRRPFFHDVVQPRINTEQEFLLFAHE
jgi:hypothetical protein